MAKLSSQGAILRVQDAANAFIVVEQVRSWNGLDGQASEIDVTCLESTAKEVRLGLQDFGTFSIEVLRDDTIPSHARLFALQQSGDVEQFELTNSAGTVYSFDGLVQSFSYSGGVDGVDEGSLSIRITGPVVVV